VNADCSRDMTSLDMLDSIATTKNSADRSRMMFFPRGYVYRIALGHCGMKLTRTDLG